MGGARHFEPRRPSQQVAAYSVIGKEVLQLGRWEPLTPHRDRAIGGAKAVVVRLRRMSIESGRSLAEARRSLDGRSGVAAGFGT